MRQLKLIPILLILLVIGCASQSVMTPDQMTPKQRATFAMNLYSNAYDNYLAQFAATPKPVTGDQQKYFQAYKQFMTYAEPIVTAYSQLTVVGGAPTPEQEQQILNLIYQLQAMLMKGTVK
jgi:hypothetical protein